MKPMEMEKRIDQVPVGKGMGYLAELDKPRVMLRQEHLQELSQLLGRNIADADDLLLAARNVTTLSVKGLEGGDITLEPYLLNRLMSRCHTGDFPGFLRDRIKELLAGYAGC